MATKNAVLVLAKMRSRVSLSPTPASTVSVTTAITRTISGKMESMASVITNSGYTMVAALISTYVWKVRALIIFPLPKKLIG